MNETAKKLRDITQNAGVTTGSGKPYSVIATIKSAFGFDSMLAPGVLLQFMAAIADEMDELQAEANDANNLRQKLDSAEKKAERRKQHIGYLETALHDKNALLEQRGGTIARLTAENGKLRKQVPTERERQILALWPKWSNGDYCMFGDLWTAQPYWEREPKQLTKLSILSPKLLEEWDQAQGENFAYEWDFLRPADTTYRPEKVERPALKMSDADGVEINVGDKVWLLNDIDNELVVEEIDDESGWVRTRSANGACLSVYNTHLTHIAPDSWERLEEDAAKSDCDYFGRDASDCDRCPARESTLSCGQSKSLDIIRRAKALAGVGAEE